MKFRALKANEIDVRIGTEKDNGDVTLLLYKDARCDMNILDETGVHWKRRHYECKGNLFCSVAIYDETLGEWEERDDCGTESYTEKEKGEASDSFKRACVNWGIGRELYTAPFIYIKADKLKFATDKDGNTKIGSNGKPIVKTKFRVKDIEYSEETGAREIVRLCISDEYGNDLFTEGYERVSKAQKAQENPVICEWCNNAIKSVKGNDGSYVPVDEIIRMSNSKTLEVCGKPHTLCAKCLKDKKVITELWERDNGNYVVEGDR